MARPIRLNDAMKIDVLKQIAAQLEKARMTHTGLKIEKKFSLDGKHECIIRYTAPAWFKTVMLIDTQQDEVGWYGLCYRDEQNPALFHVKDIFVYPQKVTGTTVTPDAAEEAAWLNEFDNETFNHLRCHVHSHVHMGVTPSAVDQQFRDDRLSQLRDDDFMVFQIMNKKGDVSSAVYDFRENIFYEDKDVITEVDCDDMDVWKSFVAIGKILGNYNAENIQPAVELFVQSGMADFLKVAKEAVTKERTPVMGYYAGAGGYYNNRYLGQNNAQNKSYQAGAKTQIAVVGAKTTPAIVEAEQLSIERYEEDDSEAIAEEYLRSLYGDAYFEAHREEMLNDPYYWDDGMSSSYK